MEQQDNKTKYFLIFAVIILLILCGYLLSLILNLKESSANIQKQLESSGIQMKQLEDSITRSQSLYVTSDYLDQSLQDLDMEGIKTDLETLNAKVTAINSILVSSLGYYGTKIKSTTTKPSPNPPIPPALPCEGGTGTCANPDKYGYLNNAQTLKLEEFFTDQKVPFGSTTFKSWEENPWTLQVHSRNYLVDTVLSQDEDGQYIAHNKFQIEVEGKKYPVALKEAKIVQKTTESEFWFNPKVYLGTGVGVNVTPELRAEVVPSVDVSMFSYGPNKKQTTFSFLNIGIGAHTQQLAPAIVISPANYNVGEPLPLLDNLFVGPSVSIDTDANVSVSASLKVGL